MYKLVPETKPANPLLKILAILGLIAAAPIACIALLTASAFLKGLFGW